MIIIFILVSLYHISHNSWSHLDLERKNFAHAKLGQPYWDRASSFFPYKRSAWANIFHLWQRKGVCFCTSCIRMHASSHTHTYTQHSHAHALTHTHTQFSFIFSLHSKWLMLSKDESTHQGCGEFISNVFQRKCSLLYRYSLVVVVLFSLSLSLQFEWTFRNIIIFRTVCN